jgi:hypothetical protein
VDQLVYHVLLEGRAVGPYDRKTIVGMRIKRALTGDHVLIGTDGSRLTVADLIGTRSSAKPFNPERSGGFSIVEASFTAALLMVEGKGADVPSFKGEVELRVQREVLRLAGRFRKGLGWKEDRVKLPMKNVMHARVAGSQVDLWLRTDAKKTAPLQRITLELFTPEAASELVDWLPGATPWPGAAAAGQLLAGRGSKMLMWAAGAGVAAVVLVLAELLHRRV